MPNTNEAAKETAKKRILELVMSSKSGIAYSKLMMLEELKGSCALIHPKFPMIHYWEGLSEAAADAILELKNAHILQHEPTDTLAYLANGVSLDLPVFEVNDVERAKDLETPHWMPVLLLPVSATEVPAETRKGE